MSTELLLAASIAVCLNILIVIIKYQKGRFTDAFTDGAILVGIAYLFSGSKDALIIGAFGSLLISFYLIFKPISFDNN